MKHFLAATFIFVLSLSAKAVDLGPFEVTYAFCKDTQKIGSILNAFQLTQWPVAGLPGVVIGMSQRTSPVVDLCSYITQVKSADTADAIFMSAEKLNTISKKGYDDELALSKATFSLSSSVYDFNKGKRRAASLDSVYTAGKFGGYMAKINKYQAKKQREEEQQQEQEKVLELARLARERAIIQEASQCPVPKSDKDFTAVYQNEYEPVIKKKTYFEKDSEFLYQQLVQMGPRFIKNTLKWKEFDDALKKLYATGITYDVSNRNETVSSTEKTGERNADGTAKTQKVDKQKTSQIFTARINDKAFSDFFGKYSAAWSNWAGDYWYSVSREEGGAQRLQSEFGAIANDCNPARLGGEQFDDYDPRAVNELEKRKASCESNKQIDRRRAQNLFEYYVKELKQSLFMYKQYNGKIWTMDSYYLGRNRVVTVSMKDEVAKENVVCSDNLSIADMQLLSLKSQTVNTQLNETIATESMKQSTMMENQLEAEQQEREEMKVRREILIRDKEEQDRNLQKAPRSGSF